MDIYLTASQFGKYPGLATSTSVNNCYIFTALGGEYKAEQNRCRELGVLPKFQRKTFLKIHEYPSADDFEGKKRLHGV